MEEIRTDTRQLVDVLKNDAGVNLKWLHKKVTGANTGVFDDIKYTTFISYVTDGISSHAKAKVLSKVISENTILSYDKVYSAMLNCAKSKKFNKPNLIFDGK